jgi:hypothetical protein
MSDTVIRDNIESDINKFTEIVDVFFDKERGVLVTKRSLVQPPTTNVGQGASVGYLTLLADVKR